MADSFLPEPQPNAQQQMPPQAMNGSALPSMDEGDMTPEYGAPRGFNIPGLNMAPGSMKPREPQELQQLRKWAAAPNVAEDIDESELNKIGGRVAEGYEIDSRSRGDWEDRAYKALEIAKQKREEKSYPFPGAANVNYPLLTTASLQFAARAYPAIISGREIVRAKLTGGNMQGELSARGSRIGQHMSHQLLEEMEDWEGETDMMLHQMPVVGGAARKVFWRFEADRPKSTWISLINLVVNQKVKSLESAPRISHSFQLYPQEVEERKRAGTFLDVDLHPESAEGNDDQAPLDFIEQHCYYDLDGDDFAEPWIITIHEQSEKVVRITAGFDVNEIRHDGEKITRIPREDYFVIYPFIPDPEGGFYPIGFGFLLESITSIVDTTMNQMIDAGHLQNAGGGFIGSGLTFKKTELRFEPGVYHTVDALGQDIRTAIVNMEHPGPSMALFQLLTMMIDAAKQITSIQDILTGDMTQDNVAPTTILALIEQGHKVFTAIYKRIFKSLSKEFRIIYRLNRKYLSDKSYSEIIGQPSDVGSDYADDNMVVCPVADPTLVTEMQRIARAQMLTQLQMQPPYDKLLDPQKTLVRLLAAAGIDNYMEVIQQNQGPNPEDQMKMEMMQRQIDKLQSEIDFNTARASAKLSEAHTQGIKAHAMADAAQFKAAEARIKAEDASVADMHLSKSKGFT
jgi:chaperonin GroES